MERKGLFTLLKLRASERGREEEREEGNLLRLGREREGGREVWIEAAMAAAPVTRLERGFVFDRNG